MKTHSKDALMQNDAQEFLKRLAKTASGIHVDSHELLLRILKTCHEMLKDRGCTDIKEYDSWYERASSGKPIMESNSTLIFLCLESKVGVKYARALLTMDKFPIIVSIDGPTSFTRKELNNVQFLTCSQLLFNVTHHSLVPKCYVCDPPFEVDSLPKILQSDPVAQYYNWELGTVVCFTRMIAGDAGIPYYRVVSAG